MFRTIVVGHDGTAAADVALRLAERLAADGALLLLARVVPAEPLLAHALPHGHEPALRDAAVPELEELRPGIKGALRIATRAVTNDSVAHGLVAIAEAEGADLIVVGSDRRRGDYRAHGVLGLRLLRGAPCAVAIAPADADVEIRHIGVAYDGSAEADLALEAAYALARGLRAAVTLYLAVLPDPAGALDGQQVHREARALLDAAAARAPEGVNPETVIATGYAGLAIAERAAGVVDLLVVGSRQQGPVRRVLLGSTSRAIALAVECALLVTPRGAGAHARARAERDRRPGGADVVVEHLSKRFGGQVTALDDVSLHLRSGEFTLLTGPSGSGKSTLLNLIAGLDRPDAGRVVVDGLPVAALTDPARYRREVVGIVFQLHHLLPALTAEENVELPLLPSGLRRAERLARARAALAEVGLEAHGRHLPSQLSGGERQSVAVARALAARPRLLLADEPTAALDSHAAAALLELLADLCHRHGMTVLLVSHASDAASFADRVLHIRDGRVAESAA